MALTTPAKLLAYTTGAVKPPLAFSSAKGFIPLESGGLGVTSPSQLTTPQKASHVSDANTAMFDRLPITDAANAPYTRPRYGTKIKPQQDIASIYTRRLYTDNGNTERTFVTRDFSVQVISYGRSDIMDLHSTLPNSVFAQFRGDAPVMCSFTCVIMNTLDFDWEREWDVWRKSTLNARLLAAAGKVLEIHVDGMVYVGYIVGDQVQKQVTMEAAPALTFNFLCLDRHESSCYIVSGMGSAAESRNTTGTYYVDADFRKFITEYVPTSAHFQPGVLSSDAWWDYYGWVQDPRDIKALKKESFLDKFLKGVLDYISDPRKAMTIAQAIISGDTHALGNYGVDMLAGSASAGLLAGAQGTSYSGMVNALLENGAGTTMVSQLCRGEWRGGLHSFTGMSGGLLRSTQASKPVKAWGGAAIGLGAWSERKYFGVKKQAGSKSSAWG